MNNYLKNLILTLIVLLVLSPLTTNALTQLPLQSTTPEKSYVEGEVIVKYKDTAVTTKTKQSNELLQTFKKNPQMNDIVVEDNINNLNIAKVSSDDKTTQKLIEELSKNEAVELVEPNYIKTPSFIPNDTYFSQQWAHRNTGQSVGGVSGTNDADIDSTEMWDIADSGSADTIVAVIDSGVDYTHTELSTNMWDGTNCVNENNNSISGGCPKHGWYYADINGTDSNDPIDAGTEEGHGTLVSSIIASNTNNNSGVTGISRYNHVKIMAIRFGFDVYSELKAIDFARYNGARVINASFGGANFSQFEKDAINAFPGIVVTASGNGGSDGISDDNDVTPSYPCNYTSSNIICVAATDQDDNLASFSNYGSPSVDIAAPGVRIIGIYQGGYVYGNGTSFATPFVSGIATLMYAHKPTASISTIKNTLLKSSDHITSLNDKISCSRRLNVHKSLQSIINDTIPTESCPTPIYRFYSRKYQSHLYTSSESEKNNIINNWPTDIWEYQRVELLGYDKTASDVSPVYRFWSKKYRTLYYTTIESERDDIIKNWPDEIWEYQGPRLYVYTTSSTNRVPVYRMWSKKYKASYFTTNTNQRDCMIKKYPDYIWRYENISWWVPKESLDSSVITKC